MRIRSSFLSFSFLTALSITVNTSAFADSCPIDQIYHDALTWANTLVDSCIAREAVDSRYGYCAAAGACAKLTRKVVTDSKLSIELGLDGEIFGESSSPGSLGLKINYSFHRQVEEIAECYSVHQAFADNVSLMVDTLCKSGPY